MNPDKNDIKKLYQDFSRNDPESQKKILVFWMTAVGRKEREIHQKKLFIFNLEMKSLDDENFECGYKTRFKL